MIFAHIDWEIDEDCVQRGEVANPSGKGMLPEQRFPLAQFERGSEREGMEHL
jgi:hypothetical protein